MLKLTSLKFNCTAKRILSAFLVWTAIWVIILYWKTELLSKGNKKLAYRISMPGCQIKDSKAVPKYLLWLNMPYLYVPKCSTQQFNVTNRQICLENMPENVNCTVTPFKRLTDEQNVHGSSQLISPQRFHTIQSKAADFFQLECLSNSSETILRDYGFLAPTIESNPNIKSFENSKKTYSVLLLGFNKITSADADMQLKLTMDFLRKQHNFLEFRGFNGLGSDAVWNMLAILTGRKDDRNVFHLDELNFVWKAYSANRFYTVFGENSLGKSLFNSPFKSFKQQPTDYYLRPFLLQIAKDKAFQPKPEIVTPGEATDSYMLEPYFRYKIPYIEEKCKGSRHEQHIVLELMQQFLPFYLNRLTFSFYWFSKNVVFLPHDDAAIVELFNKYKTAGVLNRTFVFIVSNVHYFHPRDTQQTTLRQPLLLALVPEEFKKHYPTAYEHFKANTRKLTTPYDLHATLLHLANFTANATGFRKILINGHLKSRLYGISLLNETISNYRTCRDANVIKSCLCQ